MTTTFDTAPDGAQAGSTPRPDAPSTFEHTGQPMERAMIAVALLTAHPDNVRRDISLNQEFLDSIAEQGVLTPLRITPDSSGGYRVIEGHRRLAAAEKLGLKQVPYDLAAEREHDEAGQFLDMYTVNHHRKGFTVLEEADALFGASQHGASKTRIRKATGLGKEQLSAALSAAGMRGVARATAEGFGDAITLDQLALLAEFGDDEEAAGRLTTAFCEGTSGQHVAERIRQERAEAAEHEQLVAQFLADGYTVAEELPPNGCMLHALAHDGQELTSEAHTQCPGRAVYFHRYQPLYPRHFCTGPEANGHASRYQGSPLPDLSGNSADDDAEGSALGTGTGTAADPGPERRLVIEGNRAWVAARNVRKRWLADALLTRRTAPKQAMPFITAQLLTMPQALRDALTRAPKSQLFTDLAGQGIKADAIGAWAPARLPLALLAVIATAYEDRMDGDAGRATWRTDQRFTQCDRSEAGTYLRFLRDAGYELSPVEQAVADGVPYAGDEPQEQPSEPQDDSGYPGDSGDPAEADPESRNDADAVGQVSAA